MPRLLPLVPVLLLLCPSVLLAEQTREDLEARLGQLEVETQALRGELQQLRERPVRLPEVQATPASWAPAAKQDEAADYYTFEQVQQMMDETAKKHAWRKGDFTVIPYGFLWGNMVYETEESYTGSYALYILSAEKAGDDNFVVDGRNTRLGFDVAGPRLWLFNCAPSGGKVEIDFQGSFVTENKAGLLLRHAYWEVKDDDFRILMGQTWDVISPLYPSTTMYSVYWDAGNIGYRRPQVRGERYLKLSPTSMITLQGSLDLDIVSDYTTDDEDDIEGKHEGWPIIEGRSAWTLGPRGKDDKPIVLGASGHIGNQDFRFGSKSVLPGEYVRRTWSLNADFQVPILPRFGVQGEFFTGENLGAFLGGIGQGVNVDLDADTVRTIRSTGGWFEFWYDLAFNWHAHAGFTIDDPFDQDITTDSGRTYNSVYYANLIHEVTKQFQLGFEVGSWKTLYKGLEPGESVRFEFMAKYGF
jgi:hypothetical protein